MPTGGVTRENAGDWIRAGAVAIGVGTALVDPATVAARRFDVIRDRAPRVRRGGRGGARDADDGGAGMIKTVCFGEIMLRLSPPGFERLLQSPVLGATFGGGEANVAVSLAQFGCDSWYVTRVPAHAIGDAAVRALRAEGVNVEHVLRGGSRLGIYFAETGASQRASTVIYDRAHSAISELAAGQRAVARRLRRRGLVPLDRHHPGAQPRRRRVHARGDRGGAARGRARVGRSQLPQEAVVRGTRRSRRCGR